jgi:putative membrane protein
MDLFLTPDGRPAFLTRLLVTALGLWAAAAIVPGFEIHGFWSLLLAAFLFGLVNAVVRPVMVILTLPLTILTLGLFLLVVNGTMLGFVAWMMKDFHIAGLFPAILGSIVVSVISWAVSR